LAPADALANHILDTPRRSQAQRSSASKTVDGRPYHVTGHLRRVGKEQEGTTRKGRVEEVLAGTTKHFLADHHAEADAQRYLPQRNARRQNQGKQDRGYEETFVDFV